jgi:beta-N-acetylhexosaminidase
MIKQSPRHSHRRLVTLVISAVLVALIAIGSIIGQRLLDNPSNTSFANTAATGGTFVQPPLSAAQVYSLHHIVSHMQYKQLASLYVSHMSLDEELGQLIMVEYNDTSYSPDLDTMVNKLHAGGVIMYEFQMQTAAQTKYDIGQMQAHAKIPLLISSDEEGGIVHRLINIYPPRPSALSVYQSGNPAYAAQQGHLVAHDLKAIGINENLAPDVDVALIPDAPDQITRTYGFTTDSVIQYAGPYMQAMQSDGVIACIKHYPGLGDASIDAHFGLPVVNRTRDQLYSVELAPFKHFIQSQNKLDNPGMIMPTDVLMPAIDPKMPAELSHIFMTDILRHQFGYDGVVLTDALYMQGISQTWSMPEAAVLALNAGDDMLLGPTGTDQMVAMLDGLKAALQNGTLSKARVDEAATRIIALKMQYHLMPAVPPK